MLHVAREQLIAAQHGGGHGAREKSLAAAGLLQGGGEALADLRGAGSGGGLEAHLHLHEVGVWRLLGHWEMS